MIVPEPNRRAELVANLHSPWRATVAECLDRWIGMDGGAQAHSYIVVEGVEPGVRHTLNSSRISELAAAFRTPHVSDDRPRPTIRLTDDVPINA